MTPGAMFKLQPVVLAIASNRELVDLLVQDLGTHHFFAFGVTSVKEGIRSLDFLLPDVVVVDPTSDEAFALLDELHARRQSVGLVAIAESEATAQRAREMGIDEVVMGDNVSAIVDAVTLLIPEEPVPASPVQGTRILVVDDEAAIVDILSETLGRRGYSIVTAASGREALAIVEHDPGIALVLLDVILPEMGGIETLKELRGRRPHIGVIMMSAMMDAEIACHAVELGAFDYILKPINLEELEDRIVACLASEEYRHIPWWKRLTN